MMIPAALTLSIFLAPGCSEDKDSPLYTAEKDLFNARKQSGELQFPTPNSQFLERTLASYRTIVEENRGSIGSVEGMRITVVTAQMELAELEFRAGLLSESRNDFQTAYELAVDIPEARANALWSAGFISQQIGDGKTAREMYERFANEFLGGDQRLKTAGLNRRYLLVPVRLAEMALRDGDETAVSRWLGEAEEMFGALAASTADEDLIKEMRFNLLTVYLLKREWERAATAVREMKADYESDEDIPGLLLIESKIQLDGLRDDARAMKTLERIVTGYPDSREAPTALLTMGNIHFARNELDRAEEAYESVIDRYKEAGAEIVESTWQLAHLEEQRGDWVEASLHYKALYTNFPTSIQGMESPLKIAQYYAAQNEPEAATAAYDRALEIYERIATQQYPEMVRILAEEYYVRTLIIQSEWEKAAKRLLELPDLYPGYTRFGDNYLAAASIYENELGDPGRAASTLEACIANYPGTSLAAEAEKQYSRIKGTK
jgi:TolA-binding protein